MPSFRNSHLLTLQQEAGAHFVGAHSWDLLTDYGDPVAEHHALRTTAGLADPAFVAITKVTGRGAAEFLAARLDGMPAEGLEEGQGTHAYLTNNLGGILADPMVYRCGEAYLLLTWIDKAHSLFHALHHEALGSDVLVTDESGTLQVLAVEGPRALDALLPVLGDEDASAVRDMVTPQIRRAGIAGTAAHITRFSFSGEDGFHLIIPRDESPRIWARLLEAVRSLGGLPVGADAVNSTRVEAGLPVYGHEYSSTIALPDLIRLNDGDPAPRKKLVGLRAKAGIPEPLTTGLVVRGEEILGETTSLVHSPTFGQTIAIAILDAASAAAGDEVEVQVNGANQPFILMDLPFYAR
ncbi:glycine cleavage T C-terminal barrel domain-containing protein [Corynebacterium guangdongense]|uniref:Aminomethyltransferase n=1 Tax=Corynebacterium guangdongense TaxID=1783348 RepID=A0ABU1ZYE1_9CORY|nr:glycine cleavage T C-terminal barrel domain-containing protein [Corynebacterium guangdongense]MDR7329780.1 aminomethyltransferase [Corynebacterium guangdongense]WJZ18343.1 Aminomethyltransferase [Corynebacterium guangdongense]